MVILALFPQDPEKRPTASELLKHEFVSGELEPKPLRDLLLEYRAEVVEEELLDDEAEVPICYHWKLEISEVFNSLDFALGPSGLLPVSYFYP
jgi:hypothetical protein